MCTWRGDRLHIRVTLLQETITQHRCANFAARKTRNLDARDQFPFPPYFCPQYNLTLLLFTPSSSPRNPKCATPSPPSCSSTKYPTGLLLLNASTISSSPYAQVFVPKSRLIDSARSRIARQVPYLRPFLMISLL